MYRVWVPVYLQIDTGLTLVVMNDFIWSALPADMIFYKIP